MGPQGHQTLHEGQGAASGLQDRLDPTVGGVVTFVFKGRNGAQAAVGWAPCVHHPRQSTTAKLWQVRN